MRCRLRGPLRLGAQGVVRGVLGGISREAHREPLGARLGGHPRDQRIMFEGRMVATPG